VGWGGKKIGGERLKEKMVGPEREAAGLVDRRKE